MLILNTALGTKYDTKYDTDFSSKGSNTLVSGFLAHNTAEENGNGNISDAEAFTIDMDTHMQRGVGLKISDDDFIEHHHSRQRDHDIQIGELVYDVAAEDRCWRNPTGRGGCGGRGLGRLRQRPRRWGVGTTMWLQILWQEKQRGPVRRHQHRRRQLRRSGSTVAEGDRVCVHDA